ncbi:alpha-1,2-mannosyltransferase ALG9-like [Pomacea canaliculata]|uniref:alpha-1,2-mannosyltransferase ALG9-like n=1 Tax=Pomacea canaliculata TaxID=400727 RepID=UPI000D73F684|nr:alpha-1,2-mannosyltransferase ALG9-like [Pomacea canaliculata]
MMSNHSKRRQVTRFTKESAGSASASSSNRHQGYIADGSQYGEKAKSVVQDMDDPWSPTTMTAFKLLMSARLCAALWNIVTDCDETYNYWESAHYLLYGYGFQTWEYSPVYAIRSYAYILPYLIPMRLFEIFLTNNKILIFYLLRCCLGTVCAACEVYLYKAVNQAVGTNVARLMLWFLLLSTGMFIACTAFLPSSFSMYLTMVAVASWLTGKNNVAILAVAASTIIGWPFAAALGLPIAFDVIFRQKQVLYFGLWCIISAVVFLLPVVLIDTHYYGRLVIAPLNIIFYNVFTSHGPDLYGVEPMSYYILNGFLNFNIIFLAACVSLPAVIIGAWVMRLPANKRFPVWLILAPMYIWILIFFTRPHKEERFLFPIYPFFALGGAVFVDIVQKLWSYIMPEAVRARYTESSNIISIFTGILFSLLCLSRSVALYQGYHASMDIFVELHKVANDPKVHTLPFDKHVNICMGKDWYRFPSNFFLPSDRWHLQFIKSEFKGLLPKAYEPWPNGTRLIPSNMNDLNKEEPSRYIDISRCHYLVDLDVPTESSLEPRYAALEDWTVVASAPFLDAGRSHRLLRAFYIPFVSAAHCHYADYNILKTTRTKKSVKHTKL